MGFWMASNLAADVKRALLYNGNQWRERKILSLPPTSGSIWYQAQGF